MVRPASIDPPEISVRLWKDFAGQRAFDVGTNCGQSLPLMAGRFAVVTGFEPCAESFEQAHTAFPGIEVLNIAVSDHDGEVLLARIDGEQADTGQLVSAGTHGAGNSPEVWSRAGVTPVRVSCRTLDTLAVTFGPPDFVKVDTEGHEYRVLLGAPRLLRERRASWLVEFHSLDLYRLCKELLEAADYEVETVRHPHYAPGSAEWHMHGWLRSWPRRWPD